MSLHDTNCSTHPFYYYHCTKDRTFIGELWSRVNAGVEEFHCKNSRTMKISLLNLLFGQCRCSGTSHRQFCLRRKIQFIVCKRPTAHLATTTESHAELMGRKEQKGVAPRFLWPPRATSTTSTVCRHCRPTVEDNYKLRTATHRADARRNPILGNHDNRGNTQACLCIVSIIRPWDHACRATQPR
jgi:hypothetical protein